MDKPLNQQPETLTPRQLIQTAYNHLNSVKHRDPSVQVLLGLLQLLHDEAVVDLLRAKSDTFERIQGAALAISNLKRNIENDPPPPIKDI